MKRFELDLFGRVTQSPVGTALKGHRDGQRLASGSARLDGRTEYHPVMEHADLPQRGMHHAFPGWQCQLTDTDARERLSRANWWR